jgi:hypothetical protein
MCIMIKTYFMDVRCDKILIDVHFDKTYFIYVLLLVCYIIITILN